MAVTHHRESSVFDDLERRILDYAEALTRTPTEATDAMVLELRKDLNDEELVELTATIAWENFRARFNRGFDVEQQGFSQGACCPIPDRPSRSDT